MATRAGKMKLSCPLVLFHIINALLTKLVRSRWLDIDLVPRVFMDLDFVSVHKHAKKELRQYPPILTSRLVNNPYITINLNSLVWKLTVNHAENIKTGPIFFNTDWTSYMYTLEDPGAANRDDSMTLSVPYIPGSKISKKVQSLEHTTF